ncbi:MAG: hypothetical protein U9P10_09655 [Thermodesulfobacteriota bacterium]|nr:hypothetical protein [Thermodesulfobacteriota bacterium]
MKSIYVTCAVVCAIILLWTIPVAAYDTAPRISDKKIVERLTRLEEGQKALFRELDKRFEAMDKRFEAMDKRFESIDKRFEAMDKRFESIDKRFEAIDRRFAEFQALVIGIIASFACIVAVIIGFAIWDRRRAVKPVENKIDLLTEDLSTHEGKLSNLLNALKKKAETDQDLAAVLRSFSIL